MYQDVKASEWSGRPQAERDQYLHVDVRTDEEYNSGHIPGAIHIPHDQMEERYRELIENKDEPILLICRSGKRSVYAAEVLYEKGFRKLYNLEGGMLEWTGQLEKSPLK